MLLSMLIRRNTSDGGYITIGAHTLTWALCVQVRFHVIRWIIWKERGSMKAYPVAAGEDRWIAAELLCSGVTIGDASDRAEVSTKDIPDDKVSQSGTGVIRTVGTEKK